VEPVRYGHGSNLMGLFGTIMVDGRRRPLDLEGTEGTTGPGDREGADGKREGPSLVRFISAVVRQPRSLLGTLDLRRWSERAVIALVMQSHDNSLIISAKRGLFRRARLVSRPGHGQPSPAWLPVGHDVVRRLARTIGGQPAGTWGEIFGMPMTAHFLGGCVIGASASEGVIDRFHRVYSYPGLYVVDGSAIPANPGANPSLTITAMAERAFSYWPNKGEPDPRPALEPSRRHDGSRLTREASVRSSAVSIPSGRKPLPAEPPEGEPQRVDTVPPKWPVVPAGAAGALRPG
jgi:cholesterol oxidase